jgi:hypothetical protein
MPAPSSWRSAELRCSLRSACVSHRLTRRRTAMEILQARRVILGPDGEVLDTDTVPPGGRLAVPMEFCDSDTHEMLTRIALLRRAYGAADRERNDAAANEVRADAYAQHKQEISQMWRGSDAGKGPYGVTPSDKPDAEAAYAARSERLASAWQNVAAGGPTPRAPKADDPSWLKTQRRNYKPGLASYDVPGDSAAVTPDSDDGVAQAQRDAAHAKYVARICSAWKESQP